MRSIATALLTLSLVGLAGAAEAQDHTIPYRGHLELNGIAQTGVFAMRFELFGASAGGAPLQTFDQDVVVTAGEFAVDLEPVLDTTLAAPELHLQLSVGPQGTTPTLLPNRQRIRAVPFAARAEPTKVFHADDVVAIDVTASTAHLGAAVVDEAGHLRTPAFVHAEPVTDGQGIIGGSIPWVSAPGANPALCSPTRADCVGVDAAFDSYNGTVTFDIEATVYRPSVGGVAVVLILDPNAAGVGLNAGRIQGYASQANVHFSLPNFHGVIPRQYTDCTTPPCRHVLRILPRGGATLTSVDTNDYLRVTFTELPF